MFPERNLERKDADYKSPIRICRLQCDWFASYAKKTKILSHKWLRTLLSFSVSGGDSLNASPPQEYIRYILRFSYLMLS